MSDELRMWLEQVRDERNQAQVALQNGDDGPMRLWALRHGHVLIDKCEELAGALEPFARKAASARPFGPDYVDIDLGDCFRARKALRAPGGGDRA